jgi:hypothetical protein
MAKPRVVLNRRVFGEQVMASAALERQLEPYADSVAAQIPGATVTPIVTGVGTVSARVRLRVEAEADQRAALIAALRSVVGTAKNT